MEIVGHGLFRPSGLCYLKDTNELLVANEINLLLIRKRALGCLNRKSIDIELPNVSSYTDVSVSVSGRVALSDQKGGCVHVYTKDDCDFHLFDRFGSQNDEMIEGDAAVATIERPMGVQFDGEAMYICCYGTGLKLHTYTTFAVEYCKQVEKIYITTGYASNKEEEQQQVGLTFSQRLKLVEEVVTYMKRLNEVRKRITGKKYISTEHGGVYPATLECLESTYHSISDVSQVLSERGCDIEQLNFYSFTNESFAEHGFGHGVQQGQYSVLSHEQYVMQKVKTGDDLIRRCCITKFNYPIRKNKQYIEPLQFNVSADDVFGMRDKVLSARKKKSEQQSEELKNDINELRSISRFFRPQPTQGVRDKYKAPPGFAPSVTTFTRMAPADQELEFDSLYAETSTSATEASAIEDKVLEAGDIVAALAGEEDGVVSADDWWLFRVKQDLFRASKLSNVYGQWLEYESTDSAGNQLYVDGRESSVYFSTLLKDEMQLPFLIVRENYDECDDGIIINPEVCSKLDELVTNIWDAVEEAEQQAEEAELQEPEAEEPQQQQVTLPLRRPTRIRRGDLSFTDYAQLLKGD